MSMTTKHKIYITNITNFYLVLACLLLGGGARSAIALPIRGSVSVIIQPPDAVDQGTQWSIDSGPAQGSGEAAGSVTAPTLSIPGSVSVIIQPPEAVAQGAQWSIDSGPAQASGAVVGNVTAGTHSIRFVNLAAWQEPDAIDVLVIG